MYHQKVSKREINHKMVLGPIGVGSIFFSVDAVSRLIDKPRADQLDNRQRSKKCLEEA